MMSGNQQRPDLMAPRTWRGDAACPQDLSVTGARGVALVLGILVTLNLLGCQTPVNMSAWQRSLEHYVQNDGRGDPTVLRALTIQNDRRGYELIGGDDPRHTTDARGLLLGHRMAAGRPWFIYLVGIVKDQKVREMHLAALALEGNRFHWVLGPKNSHAMNIYRNYNEGLGKQRNPGRRHAPTEYSGFPRSEDQFDLSINGNRVNVIHKGSGACWELTLPASEQTEGRGGRNATS